MARARAAVLALAGSASAAAACDFRDLPRLEAGGPASLDEASVPMLHPLCLSLPWANVSGTAPSARVTLPGGGELRLPFFRFANRTGPEVWQARFTPRELGLSVIRLDGGGAPSLPVRATPAPPGARGFVGMAPNRRHFMDAADNSTFVPVGLNVAWPPGEKGNGSAVEAFYDAWFARIEQAGGNYARLWLGPTLAPPWNPLVVLRRFDEIDLQAALVMDGVLAAAQRRGIKVLLTLDSFNTLCPDAVNSECRWAQSVWNRDNGGPLAPALGFLSFWSDARAAAAWKAYQSYVAARWGSSPAVFAFQLFNEVDAAMFDVVPGAYRWHKEMAAALRECDPYSHLVSESFGLAVGNPMMDSGAAFDFSTTHSYARADRGASPDVGPWMAEWTAEKVKLYDKPSFVGEFGCDDDAGQPTTREALHDGVWAPLFAGGAASGMFWYWDSVPYSWWQQEFAALNKYLSLAPPAIGDLAWAPLRPAAAPTAARAIAVQGSPLGGGAATWALLWLHSHNASNPCTDPGAMEVPSFDMSLPLPAGRWEVNWVNTTSGAAVSTALSMSRGAGVTLRVPSFRRDIALAAVRRS
eukprot:TRINITY_DN9299_c0_g1_i1.p1 TRINITY_DN9299_c0_g1~~TRINITY_DN9299_c0_g1_i1.p1  ORF type:complete len:582 (+),score=152.78 TRINITY_DN9299_c0_g1_i1:87-1832(+)